MNQKKMLRKTRKLLQLILASPFWVMGRLLQIVKREVNQDHKTFYELEKLAYQESARYIFDNMEGSILMTNLAEFREYAIAQAPKAGLLMEFGVYKGNSINQYADVVKSADDGRLVYGFDSFEGLSENWTGYSLLKSRFDQKGRMPIVRDNVKLVKGWVDQTYPNFLQEHLDEHENSIAFMFLDMDTYTPTKFVLEQSLPYLKEGSVVAFDELLGYTGWRENEYKALMETIDKKFYFQYICFSEHRTRGYVSMYTRAALKITGEK